MSAGDRDSLQHGGVLGVPVVDKALFKQGFSPDDFLGSLLRQQQPGGVQQPAKAAASKGAAVASAAASLVKVKTLLATVDQADVELVDMHREVALAIRQLQGAVKKDEKAFEAGITTVEAGTEGVREAFKQLESRSNKVNQVATRIGDRLQTADKLRSKASDLIDLLGYLQMFSVLPESDGFTKLPPLFWQDELLHQAVSTTKRLVTLVNSARSATQRSRLVRSAQSTESVPSLATAGAAAAGKPGTLEYTARCLGAYYGQLEGRVLARFDAALTGNDVEGMGECTRMLSEFNREGVIVERFVRAQGVVASGAEVAPKAPLTSADEKEVQARLLPLSQMYMQLVSTVEIETPRLRRIFATPTVPLELLVQRVFDGRIWPLMQTLLQQVPPTVMSAGTRQAHLRVLAGSFALTKKMVADVAAAAGGLLDAAMGSTMDSVFGAVLQPYPQAELDWLTVLFEAHQSRILQPVAVVPGMFGNGLSAPLSPLVVTAMAAANAEAIKRCQQLSPSSRVAFHVRLVFHGGGPFEPGTGALLEQMARHIMGGIEHAYDSGPAQDRPPPPPPPPGQQPPPPPSASEPAAAAAAVEPPPPPTKANSVQRSQRYISNTARKVFDAVVTTAGMMADIQQHYNAAVRPLVAGSLNELTACNGGLVMLLKAVEETTVAVLDKTLGTFFGTVERVLTKEQQVDEFQPLHMPAGGFDRPTDACVLVTSLVTALLAAAQETLQGSNLASLLLEVGRRLHDVLRAHMRRFIFSANGALRWKNDLSEYTDALRAFNEPAVVERLLGLQARVNILIVPPDTVLGLINGTLRLDHREALEYVQLREDFFVSRIEGKTFAQLLNAVGAEYYTPALLAQQRVTDGAGAAVRR